MVRRLDNQLPATDPLAIRHLPGGLFYAIRNPLTDGTWQYEWVNGRPLARIYSIDTDASLVYNENGLRVQKTVNGEVTNNTLHGKNIVHMTKGDDELHFFYDAQDKPAIVMYNGVPYSYVKNLQGDIVAILDSNGTTVVQYKYDAWGKPISKTGTMATSLGELNPFRYRGYVYDEEIGVYYLRHRYYSSMLCRFISSDNVIGSFESLGDKNAYSYCNGDPVRYADMDGKLSTDNLNELAQQYTSGLIGEEALATAIIAGNGLNVYQAFHEIAQVHAYAELSSLGINVQLEVPIKFGSYLFGEMDIACSTAVWEVKPEYINGYWQCATYAIATGKGMGNSLVNIDGIYVVPGLYMNLHSYWYEPGVIHYELVNDDWERVKNAAAKVIVGAGLFVGIVGTLIEDVVTLGGGIGNDAPVFDAFYRYCFAP